MQFSHINIHINYSAVCALVCSPIHLDSFQAWKIGRLAAIKRNPYTFVVHEKQAATTEDAVRLHGHNGREILNAKKIE